MGETVPLVKEESRVRLDKSSETADRKDDWFEAGGEEDDREGEWNSCLVDADAAERDATSATGFGGGDDVLMDVEGTVSVDAAADGDTTEAMLPADGLVSF